MTSINLANAAEEALALKARKEEAARLREQLAAPFDPGEVKFKPGSVKGNRALAMAYIDARLVMDRLDDVFGLGGWEHTYRETADRGVVCTLRVWVLDRWVTHEDVGSPSEQPDAGDRQKAAFSDALKRAAVHVGVGRYLYRATNAWHDFDAVKKKFAYDLTVTKDGQIVPAPRTPPAASGPPAGRRHYDPLLDKVGSRADLGPIWKDYDADCKAGRVSDADKAHLDGRFKTLAARFPKPAEPAKA